MPSIKYVISFATKYANCVVNTSSLFRINGTKRIYHRAPINNPHLTLHQHLNQILHQYSANTQLTILVESWQCRHLGHFGILKFQHCSEAWGNKTKEITKRLRENNSSFLLFYSPKPQSHAEFWYIKNGLLICIDQDLMVCLWLTTALLIKCSSDLWPVDQGYYPCSTMDAFRTHDAVFLY